MRCCCCCCCCYRGAVESAGGFAVVEIVGFDEGVGVADAEAEADAETGP